MLRFDRMNQKSVNPGMNTGNGLALPYTFF